MDRVEDHRDDEDFPGWLGFIQFIFYSALLVGSGYLLYLENLQFYAIKTEEDTFLAKLKTYYSDFWNYADVVPPTFIILVIVIDMFFSDVAKFRITM